MINKYRDWKPSIINAEENNYFSGEINFALKLCDIFDANDINLTQSKINEFNSNWELITKIEAMINYMETHF